MKTEKSTFQYQIDSLEEDFPPFASAFNAFCQKQNIGSDKIFDLELSLEELIVNSFTHGSSRDTVKILATVEEEEIKVVLEDRAPPFNLLREAPPPPSDNIENRKVGGLGIHLVKNLTDRIEYSGSQNGNIITLLKKIK